PDAAVQVGQWGYGRVTVGRTVRYVAIGGRVPGRHRGMGRARPRPVGRAWPGCALAGERRALDLPVHGDLRLPVRRADGHGQPQPERAQQRELFALRPRVRGDARPRLANGPPLRAEVAEELAG